MLLVGIDWAERHHDLCVMAADGQVLAAERITDGLAGLARLHELIARHASDPAEVVVGIETDRGAAGGSAGRSGLPGGGSESAGGQPLSGAPHHLGGQVGPGRWRSAACLDRA
jgi:transposase